MWGHEVAALAAIVGKVRGICKYCLAGDDRTEALDLLDEAERLLVAPNGDSDQRKKWRDQKRAQRSVRVDVPDTPELSADTSADMSAERVGVEEEGVGVGVGEEAPEVEVATPAPARPTPYAADVAAVYAHYRTHHPRCAPTLPSTSKEYRLVVAALKRGHVVAALCEAIDGYHRSPYHCGVNDKGMKYQGLDLILRDEAHIERGIEMATDPLIDRGLSEGTRRTVSAAQAWVEAGQAPTLALLEGRR